MCNSSLWLNHFNSIYSRVHLWWIILLGWSFLAFECKSQDMKKSWIRNFSFICCLEKRSYEKKEWKWGSARLCDSDIRNGDKYVTAVGAPGQSPGATFHLPSGGCEENAGGKMQRSDAALSCLLPQLWSCAQEQLQNRVEKDWNESTSDVSRNTEYSQVPLNDPLAALLHPSLGRADLEGWQPSSSHIPLLLLFCLLILSALSQPSWPYTTFYLVLPEPWSTWSAIIVALKDWGFLCNKTNQYKHCSRWWPLHSLRNFTSFSLLCFSLCLITWSIVPNKNQWVCIIPNYC